MKKSQKRATLTGPWTLIRWATESWKKKATKEKPRNSAQSKNYKNGTEHTELKPVVTFVFNSSATASAVFVHGAWIIDMLTDSQQAAMRKRRRGKAKTDRPFGLFRRTVLSHSAFLSVSTVLCFNSYWPFSLHTVFRGFLSFISASSLFRAWSGSLLHNSFNLSQQEGQTGDSERFFVPFLLSLSFFFRLLSFFSLLHWFSLCVTFFICAYHSLFFFVSRLSSLIQCPMGELMNILDSWRRYGSDTNNLCEIWDRNRNAVLNHRVVRETLLRVSLLFRPCGLSTLILGLSPVLSSVKCLVVLTDWSIFKVAVSLDCAAGLFLVVSSSSVQNRILHSCRVWFHDSASSSSDTRNLPFWDQSNFLLLFSACLRNIQSWLCCWLILGSLVLFRTKSDSPFLSCLISWLCFL